MWNLLAVQNMEVHVQEILHPVATERLAREGSVPTCGWLHRQKCRWLRWLGRCLVALGQWLQWVGQPPVVMEEQLKVESRTGA